MATTTNYGWVTPDDTALVKDGAAAIRTLGSSADTTTKNLNPETTLGDLSFRSSTSNVNTRIGIGTAGQNLTVVAGVPAWATASAGGMTLLSTTTLSGTSTTVSSINQTYKNLYIQVFGVTNGTGTASFQFSLNTNNLNINKVAPNNISQTRGQTTVNVEDGAQQQNNTGGNNYMNFMFYNYASTTNYKAFDIYGTYDSATTNGRVITIFGGVSSNTAIDSFTFTNDAAYTFNAGTILCYGVN